MAATIAKVQTGDREVNQLQTNITSVLNPLLQNPLIFGTIIASQVLAIGSNTINHTLNRTLIGWSIVRQRSLASIYDDQDNNPLSNQTLILVSDAPVTIDVYVF